MERVERKERVGGWRENRGREEWEDRWMMWTGERGR